MKNLATTYVFLYAAIIAVAAEDFFPKGSVGDSQQEGFGKYLTAMREPILKPGSTNDTQFAFRILYLPTWGRPLSVRYWNSGTNFLRRSVMLSGTGGYDPGTIKKESQIEVSKKETDQLFAKLEKMKFWNMAPKDDVLGYDGSELIMEAIRGKEHKVVVRWTPDYDSKQRHLEAIVDFYQGLFEQTQLIEKPDGKAPKQTK
jgi:hypothetical protein